MTRSDFARIFLALIVSSGIAIAAQQSPLLGAMSNGQRCAVGHNSVPVGSHSHPVGNHSKPCPTPPGCAIGQGGPVGIHSRPVGNHSKPCPTPPGCAIGGPRFVGKASKPCPTPERLPTTTPQEHGHQ